MQLNKIFKTAPAVRIDGLAIDSRKVKDNYIFFAIDGMYDDGHKYIDSALKNGAKVIVYTKDIDYKVDGIVYIQCENITSVLNTVVSKFYKQPDKDMFIVAVTGTNGKTTTAKLIKDISQRFEASGYIGTLGVEYNDQALTSDLTTPNAIDLNAFLQEMKQNHVKMVALEASSHGLALGRLDAIHKDVVIYTNLTHEHLDFHATMEQYKEAKLKLFLEHDKFALINIDDEYHEDFIKASKYPITYGKHKEATYRIMNINLQQEYSQFTLCVNNTEYFVKTKLLAEYNLYNLTAAIATLHLKGYELDKIIEIVAEIEIADGRLTKIENNFGLQIYIDYAHTPDGFEKIFTFAKEIVPNNKIIAVFGCAGRRDIARRKIMGAIADKYCDQIILTEDDPRDDSVRNISLEIKEAIHNTPTLIIDDRYEAIRMAIENASSGDAILILSKGLERYMYRADLTRSDWMGDDQAVIDILEKKEQEYATE